MPISNIILDHVTELPSTAAAAAAAAAGGNHVLDVSLANSTGEDSVEIPLKTARKTRVEARCPCQIQALRVYAGNP